MMVRWGRRKSYLGPAEIAFFCSWFYLSFSFCSWCYSREQGHESKISFLLLLIKGIRRQDESKIPFR